MRSMDYCVLRTHATYDNDRICTFIAMHGPQMDCVRAQQHAFIMRKCRKIPCIAAGVALGGRCCL